MTVPTCPVHKSPMKEGKNGGYYCPRKNGDAWCDQRVSGSKPAPQASYSAPAQPSGQTTPRHLLVIAALDFASRVYQGTALDQGALALAQEALKAFDAELL